jgi:lipase
MSRAKSPGHPCADDFTPVILHTHEWGSGDGAPLVCLHGVTGHGGRFAELATRIDRRVVGVDLLGHGSSSWNPPWDLEAHLDALLETATAIGIDRAVWVGHSFGGRLVAELAARDTGRVAAAVLLDPALYIDPEVVRPRAEGLCVDSSFASPDEAIEARLNDGSVFTTPRLILEEEMAAHLQQDADGRWRFRFSHPAAIVAWSIMSGRGAGVPSTVPTLLVLGARSWIEPPRIPRRPLGSSARAAASTIRTATVPGGHSVLWDDFEQTAAAVVAFLDEV